MIFERASLDFYYIYFDEFYIFMTCFYLLFDIVIDYNQNIGKTEARRQVQEKGGTSNLVCKEGNRILYELSVSGRG